ncbi:MAG: CBS domain-containing protein [Candidatus Diapherotrites archaeon]|nr:CBS domain-containing protein [Candidatus Diapherotrites archaeon]
MRIVMLPELSEIKNRRKKFDLTQTELALKANVSQSIIAKIESGKIIPSYDNAKKLFDALEENKEEFVTAKELMHKKILSVKPTDPVKKAIALMEANAVSQLPVIENEQSLGTVSEKILLSGFHGKSKNPEKLAVSKIMEEPLPVLQDNAPFKALQEVLNYSEAVLISSKGKIVGIISKSDLLKEMIKKKN